MAVAGRNAFLLGQKTSEAAIHRALTLRLWRHNRRSTPRIDQKNKVLVPYISNRNDGFYQKNEQNILLDRSAILCEYL